MNAGHYQTQIAKLLDRHKSTISREHSRTRGPKGYRLKKRLGFKTPAEALHRSLKRAALSA